MLSKSFQKQEVDLRHLQCPMSLLMAKQAINKLQPRQILYLSIADSASHRDILTYLTKQAKRYQLCDEQVMQEYILLIIKQSDEPC